MTSPLPDRAFSLFQNYNPFHNIIHYYVDLSIFLISSGDDTLSPKVWWALNRRKRVTSLYGLEVRHGSLEARDRFVQECFAKVQARKKTVCGERLGFRDLFVPILKGGKILGYLQAGAFAEREITREVLEKCWKDLTGREASPALPEFREWVRALLEIPVLDGPLAEAFQEALELFARLLADAPGGPAVGRRLRQLLEEVFSKGLPHSYWMDWALNRPTSESVPAWSRAVERWGWIREEIGLNRVPTTVLTVVPRRSGPRHPDWVEEKLRVYRFQRRSFRFAQTLPETVGGKLDDYGAVFTTSADPRLPRLGQRRHTESMARQVREFAEKELGGPVLVGVGETLAPGENLGPSYRQAVLALHLGRASDRDIVFFAEGKGESEAGGFAGLRMILDGLEEAFASASFADLEVLEDRFLKQVLDISLQSPPEMRLHFQYALDRLAGTVGRRMDFGRKDVRILRENLQRILDSSATLQEMVLSFKDALARLKERVEKPSAARNGYSMEQAREYLDGHFKEPLRLSRLAKRAGVSPSTFSRRFKKLTGTGLGDYLQERRLEEARHLLKSTRLPASRIARDCGFKSYPYFVQLFHRKSGLPPQEFREKPGGV